MAMNRIQFQPGLSMPDFLKNYGSEAQCEKALEVVRWPNGFCCPRCGHAAHYVLRDGVRKVFQCNACRHQASLIAGTVFQGTKLPLTTWFLAIYLISQEKFYVTDYLQPKAYAHGTKKADIQKFSAKFHKNSTVDLNRHHRDTPNCLEFPILHPLTSITLPSSLRHFAHPARL